MAPDGSAYFKVPAKQPIYFLALDAEGRAVQRMRSFTHLMPGEVQGCVGCHESRHQTPHAPTAARRAGRAADAAPPEWGEQGFCYSPIVQPVLDKHCVEVPQPAMNDAGIDLTRRPDGLLQRLVRDPRAPTTQEATGSPYVSWIPTYNGQEWNILEITPKYWGSPQSASPRSCSAATPMRAGKPRVEMEPAPAASALLDRPERALLRHQRDGLSRTDWLRQIFIPDSSIKSCVAARRCASCHAEEGPPVGRVWTRITEPHLNAFLLAPLAQDAGGTRKCSQPVFRTTADADSGHPRPRSSRLKACSRPARAWTCRVRASHRRVPGQPVANGVGTSMFTTIILVGLLLALLASVLLWACFWSSGCGGRKSPT